MAPKPLRDGRDDGKRMLVLNGLRWLVAATLVFQISATVGAGLNPPETFTAVRPALRAASGR